MKKILAAAVFAAAALVACTQKPCEGDECTNVAGSYSASYDLDGGLLQKNGDGGVCTYFIVSSFSLQQEGSAVSLDSAIVQMTGSLYQGGSLALTGTQGSNSSSLTASVQAGAASEDGGVSSPVVLRGQLVNTLVDDIGNSCTSTVTFEATQL